MDNLEVGDKMWTSDEPYLDFQQEICIHDIAQITITKINGDNVTVDFGDQYANQVQVRSIDDINARYFKEKHDLISFLTKKASDLYINIIDKACIDYRNALEAINGDQQNAD